MNDTPHPGEPEAPAVPASNPTPAPGQPLAGSPPTSGDFSAASDLNRLREQILTSILALTSGLALIAYALNLPFSLRAQAWPALAIYTLVCLSLLGVTLARRLPYRLRAAILLAILYAVGLVALLADGLFGSGRIFLFALPVLAAVLLGFRVGIGALILSLLTFLTTGLLMTYGLILAPALKPGTGNNSLLSWLIATANFLVVGVASITSLIVFLRGLQHSLAQQKILAGQVAAERSQLEEKVALRTADLERRLTQIRTAAEITRSLGAVLDPKILLDQVVNLIRDRFNLYYVGVFLISAPTLVEPRSETGAGREAGAETPGLSSRSQNGFETPEPRSQNAASEPGAPVWAVLAAATGEAGQKMLRDNHRLLVGGSSMIGWATANCQARIALDVGQEPVRFNNPHLPNTRSELALPILAPTAAGPRPDGARQGSQPPGQTNSATQDILGAITIQSDQPAAFDQDDIIVLQGIADGLATALENARLFSQLQTSLDEIQSLHRQYLERAWSDILETHPPDELTYEWGHAAPPAPGAGRRTLQVPLALRDQIIGNLTLEADLPADVLLPPGQGWTAEEKALVDAVTIQAALALENVRLLEETRQRAEQERLTSAIVSKVWASAEIDTILRTTLKELGHSLKATQGFIQLDEK